MERDRSDDQTRAGAPMGAEPPRVGEPMDTATLGGGRVGRRGRAAAVAFIVGALVIFGLFVWGFVVDDEGVLVVTDPAQDVVGELDDGDRVQVAGSVRRFDVDQFDGLGEEGLFDDVDGRPVIVAQTVRAARRRRR
jgi:hypothetical protein